MKCNSKILISHQIFYCMFSISTCNLKNLIFLNHETFMLASSSDSSYKACMRHACVQKSTWKIQNAIPKPKFLSQAINFMINLSAQRERERERERERNLERSETSSFRWADRDSWSLSRIFSLLKSHTKLWKRKKTKEKGREPERESNREWKRRVVVVFISRRI